MCLILLVGSFWFSRHNFYRAFPEAAIEFTLTRDEAGQRAYDFVSAITDIPPEFIQVTTFSYDEKIKLFMERTLGLEQANKLFDHEVKIWKWSTRWFKPLTRQEFFVDLTPSGKFMGYRHLVREDEPGHDISSDQALLLAEDFLLSHTAIDLSALEDPQLKVEKRSNRSDHTFTWRKRDFSVAGAVYNYQVFLLGDQIGGYAEGLEVPEAWLRDYARMVSLNDTTGMVASVMSFLAFIALFVYFVKQLIRFNIRWGISLIYGGIAFFLFLLNDLNEFPLALYSYPTTESFAGFVFGSFFQSLMFSLTIGSLIFIIVAVAENFYRQDYPGMIRLESLFSWRSIRSKRFFRDILLGYTLSGLFLAYQIGFYLIADRFGAWSPATIPYSNILNTHFPWIAIICVGFLPAVSEEFFDRVFMISLFQRMFRFRWLAIVLAAMIWGFGHAPYPNQPFFIRGLEVGLAGIICGYVLLRFGILPLLVWHYTIDAFYTALVFFQSDHRYYLVTALFAAGIMLGPFIISLIMYLYKGSFESTSSLTNEAEQFPVPPVLISPTQPADCSTSRYQPMHIRHYLVISIGLIIVYGGLQWIIGQKAGPDHPDITISPAFIQDRADYQLTQCGGVLADYQSVVFLADNFVQRNSEAQSGQSDLSYFDGPRDQQALTYILQKGGIDAVNRVLTIVPDQAWVVRYYQTQQKDEWQFFFDVSSGQLIRFVRLIPEDMRGASLAHEAAISTAVSFLSNQGISLDGYNLVEHGLKSREARTDHVLTWQKKTALVADAFERVFVMLRGDQIGEYKKYIKIPESWVRDRIKRTVIYYLRVLGQIGVLVFLCVIALFRLYARIQTNKLNVRSINRLVIMLTAVVLLNDINRFHLSYANYPTAIASQTYMVYLLAGSLVYLVLHYLVFFFLMALADARFGLSDRFLYQLHDRVQARDALLLLLPCGLAVLSYQALVDLSLILVPGYSHMPPTQLVAGLDLPIPFLQSGETILMQGLLFLTVLIVAETAFQSLMTSKALLTWVLVAASGLVVSLEWVEFPEYLLGWFLSLILVSGAWGMIILLLKRNTLAYILLAFVLPLAYDASLFLDLDNMYYKANGIVLIVVCLALLFFPLKYVLRPRD